MGNFAIIRTQRVKNVSGACAHNLRTKYAKNVDSAKSHLNEVTVDVLGLADRATSKDGTYSDRLESYYRDQGVKVRDNSCLAMEFVLTASPDFFKNCSADEFQEWKKNQMDFLQHEFKDKLKFVVLHMDEATPHFHAMISVEETKVRRFKNRYGEGEKITTGLNADKFDPEFLVGLQDRYASANKKFGLQRGLRNSRATHATLKEFGKEVENFKKVDYSSTVEKAIDSIPSVMGACRKSDIKKHVEPILNKALKRVKAYRIANKVLPEKVQQVNKLQEENEKERQHLAEVKEVYRDAINSKQQDIRTIEEQKKEISALRTEVNRLKVQYENPVYKILNRAENKPDSVKKGLKY